MVKRYQPGLSTLTKLSRPANHPGRSIYVVASHTASTLTPFLAANQASAGQTYKLLLTF